MRSSALDDLFQRLIANEPITQQEADHTATLQAFELARIGEEFGSNIFDETNRFLQMHDRPETEVEGSID